MDQQATSQSMYDNGFQGDANPNRDGAYYGHGVSLLELLQKAEQGQREYEAHQADKARRS